METTIISLKSRWTQFRQEHPKVRIRDAAKALQTSEGQLVAACTGPFVKHLRPDFGQLLQELPALGRVMVLTRNEHCVIERKGRFENVDVSGRHVAVVLGADIDLRLFLNKWAYGFALQDDAATGMKKSLQFFDASGDAILKIYPQPETATDAWDQLVSVSLAAAQPDNLLVRVHTAAASPAATVNREALLADWGALKDTHDFYPMLMKHRISRVQALEAAENTFTRRVDNGSVHRLLRHAAEEGTEIMAFVGNPGSIEIHTGPVKNVLEIPEWINVMDPDFNLHLKHTAIAQCWVVLKPAEGGVSSLEVFDEAGEMIIQFFGKRKPGIPELDTWRALLGKL